MAASPDQTTRDLAQQWLEGWFLERYKDPVESCPFESPEGYEYIWGGPYSAEDVLIEAWGGIFSEAYLMAVAAHLEGEHGCLEWSATPDEDSGPCGVCGTLAFSSCDVCQRLLCGAHGFVRRQEGDTCGWDGVDVLCQTHAEPLPGTVIEPATEVSA